jgi:hypothetical protein
LHGWTFSLLAIFGANEVDDLTAEEARNLALATKEVSRHFPGAMPIDPKWLALGTLGVVIAKTYRPRVKQLFVSPQPNKATRPPDQQAPKPADAMPPQPAATEGWNFGLDPSFSTASGLH